MKLRSISDIRRSELRKAGFRVLQMEGLAGTTLERVAAEAGASKGIVLHYFANKKELFEHVMREANLELRNRVVARMARATTPMERLVAVIEGNFEPDIYKAEACYAWLSLCAQVPFDERLARIQTVIHRRMHSNLMGPLKALTHESRAEEIALGISSMVDGLWLRLGLSTEPLDASTAIAITRSYLEAELARG
jgi:TetR/AcrR family transcriptional repressor of bet genes